MLDLSGVIYIKAIIHHNKKEYKKYEKMYVLHVMECH